MKLIGSRTESECRNELQSSHESLFQRDTKLKEALEFLGHSVDRAYVLSWVPDQSDDYFTVLIDGEYIVSAEIERDGDPSDIYFERFELSDYQHGLSRSGQIKLLVAKELANEKT